LQLTQNSVEILEFFGLAYRCEFHFVIVSGSVISESRSADTSAGVAAGPSRLGVGSVGLGSGLMARSMTGA